MKPTCTCTGRTDIRCDSEHCDLACPPQNHVHGGCVICWQFLHIAAHRKLWGEDSPPLPISEDQKPPPLPPANRPPPAPVRQVQTTSANPVPAVQQFRQPTFKLGDKIEQALSKHGITQERVKKAIGWCACPQLQGMLNKLSDWAESCYHDATDKAQEAISKIIGN